MEDLTYYETLLCVMLGIITGAIGVINWGKDTLAIVPMACVLILVWIVSATKKKKEVKLN